MQKAQKIINKLSREDLINIGYKILPPNYLISAPKVEQSIIAKQVKRLISGMCNDLLNWKLNENINYGEMHKVVAVLMYLETRGIVLKDFENT
jgi:hypothetical protein